MFPIVRTVLAVSVAVAVFAFMVRPRFPDTASNRGQKTFVAMYFKLVRLAGTTAEWFGFPRVNASRALFEILLLFSRKLDTVEEYTTEMDGVEVTIYKPADQGVDLRPGIVHYHGGGWVLMEPAHYGPECRLIVQHTQSVVVSVNYRRAPEHVFPTPLEDCLKATRFFMRNAEHYGVDPNRIGVKGDSAGGNLAMAVALRLTKETDPALPKLQFMSLDYPALQAFDLELPSYRKHEKGPGCLDKDLMLYFWLAYAFGHVDYYDQFYVNNHTSSELKASLYGDFVSWKYLPKDFTDSYIRDSNHDNKGDTELSNKIQHIILDPLYAPLMATDAELRLLPPTYIMSTEFDVLRDDAFIAAARLKQAGVAVQHTHLSSEQHGLLSFIPLFDQNAVDEVVNFSQFFKRIMK